LPLRREPYGFWLFSHTDMHKYDIANKVRQYIMSRIMFDWKESGSNIKHSLQERVPAHLASRDWGTANTKAKAPRLTRGFDIEQCSR
jgi:hypothetical protein